MEPIFKIILLIHIFFGTIGLLTGTINIIKSKGTKPHFLVGKIFVFSMIVNAIAGFTLAVMHQLIFLLIVAVFSFYMVSTGQRILLLKNFLNNQKPKTIDYLLTYGMLLFGIGFVIYGSNMLFHRNTFGSVLLVFGLISLLMVRTDLKLHQGQTKHKNYWLLIHLQRMIGSYIASVTAFLVTNSHFNLGIISWLAPTVLLVPLIIKWSKQYAVFVK